MFSVILTTATRYLIPLMLIFSFFLLLRGHNEPGGGFVGGLVAAAAYSLYAIANGVDKANKLLGADPLKLIAAGLFIAMIAGMIGVFAGGSFMEGFWLDQKIPVIGKLGTPIIFDIGVYFVVMGISLKIIFSLAEEDPK